VVNQAVEAPIAYLRNKVTTVTFKVTPAFAREKLRTEPELYVLVTSLDPDAPLAAFQTDDIELPDPQLKPYSTWKRWELVEQGYRFGLFRREETIDYKAWPAWKIAEQLTVTGSADSPPRFSDLGMVQAQARQAALEAGNPPDTSLDDDYDEWALPRLRELAELWEIELKPSNTKAAVIAKLRAYNAAQVAPPAESAPPAPADPEEASGGTQ